MKKKKLTVDYVRHQIFLDDKAINCGNKWFEVIALAAERFGGSSAFITRQDISRLVGWQKTGLDSIGVSIKRKCAELAAAETPILTSPAKAATRLVGLNADLVGSIERIGAPQIGRPSSPDEESLLFRCHLLTAQRYFETGDYDRAIQKVDKLIDGITSLEKQIVALSLRLYCYSLGNYSELERSKAYESLFQVLDLGRRKNRRGHIKEESKLSPSIEAQAWIQIGRYHLLLSEKDDAVRFYAMARPLLAPWDLKEWAAIYAAEAHWMVRDGYLETALELQKAALESAQRANWLWGVHAQANNLGSIYLALADAAQSGQELPLSADEYLLSARQWYDQSLEIAITHGFGGQTNLITNMAQMLLRSDLYDDAKQILIAAEKLAQRWGYKSGLGTIARIFGDLYSAQGDRVSAIKALLEAMKYFREIGDDEKLSESRSHMRRLRGETQV